MRGDDAAREPLKRRFLKLLAEQRQARTAHGRNMPLSERLLVTQIEK